MLHEKFATNKKNETSKSEDNKIQIVFRFY